MFNVPGAKKYDFSRFNPLIVGSIVILICYLGSKNTFYDQFYNVSQLSENRNELSIIQGIVPSISGNKVLFNISIKFTFKITYENFRESFSIKIDHYGYISVHTHANFFDYKLDSNNYLSGFALSSIFGPVNISYCYLDEEIYQLKTEIPGIQLLFPGNTILSKKADHFHLSNVYINIQNQLKVYFQTQTQYDSNWIQFENGCSLPLFPSKKTAFEECSAEGQCFSHDRTTQLFAVPPNSELNAYSLFLSIFNPLVDYPRSNLDHVVVWADSQIDSKTYQLIHEMKPLLGTEIDILNSSVPNFFKELRIKYKISHNFKKLTQQILKTNDDSESFMSNKLVVITDKETKNLITKEKAKEISSVICSSIEGGCDFEVVEFSNNENLVSRINHAHFLILPIEKAHFMFPLKRGAKVFLLEVQQSDNDNDHKWINKMSKDLSIEAIFVKFENGNLNSSVFNI